MAPGISRRGFLGRLAAAGALSAGAGSLFRWLGVLGSAGANVDPALAGQWGSPLQMPLVGVHACLLRTGRVLLIEGRDVGAGNKVYVWDPVATTFSKKSLPGGTNLFCSGHVNLADGRLLLVGGHIDTFVGTRTTYAFDPVTERVKRLRDMRMGRWYPTATVLSDGRVVVVSGTVTAGQVNQDVELYDPATDAWSLLTGASNTSVTQFWALYPFMFLLGSGKVFDAGPVHDSHVLNVASPGSWEEAGIPDLPAGDVASGDTPAVTWVDLVARSQKVLVTGLTTGSPRGPFSQIITFDLDGNRLDGWRSTAQPMQVGRSKHNLSLLPTGQVLATGGANDERDVLEAEVFDPATESWAMLAPMRYPRLYHSTGFLLPDGRVAVTGTDGNDTAEIYSPRYLFQGAAPLITAAPSSLGYGGSFSVWTSRGTTIGQVALVRPSAVTHSYNMDQRHIRLPFTQGGTALTVSAPERASYAPPGYYMLFVVNSSGVPSVARWVKLG